MFQISNTRKLGDLSFVTAKGRPVRLRPEKTLSFDDDDLNDGILRTMVGKGSFYKVLADSGEAQDMIDKASIRKPKKNGSPLVHGSTNPVDFNNLKSFKVRDLKGESEDGDGKKAPEPNSPAQKPDTTKAFIQEEVKELPPLDKLLAEATGKPYGELVAEAKAIMGESFPEGRPGRPAIIKALSEFKDAQSKPQE